MVTLFVTPVIYLWLEWFQEHVLDKVPFLRSAHTHHEGETEPHPPDLTTANSNRSACRNKRRSTNDERRMTKEARTLK